MSVEEDLSQLSLGRDTILTIGVFDGVHLGHKRLLEKLIERAKRTNLLSGVVTFAPHPQSLLSPEAELPFLTSLEQRKMLLKDAGAEAVIVLPFSYELAQLNAREFVELLKEHLRLKELLIGPDFTLGRNREGNVSTLRKLGSEIGFMVTVVPPVRINGEMVSSTAIRKALAGGNLEKVRVLIGRHFSLHAKVIHGESRGAKLDYPTANLDIEPGQALPAEGVYVTWACIGGRAYESVTNIGRRPTFGGGKSVVEVYILGYRGSLYGQELKIDIIERLRGEKKFDSAGSLRQQIAKDIEQGKAVFSSKRRN